MPDYGKYRSLVSHRVTFDFDTGAKITGYVSACKPSTGAVTLLTLSKVDIIDASGAVLEHHEEFSMVPNVPTGVRVAEGPRGRDA